MKPRRKELVHSRTGGVCKYTMQESFDINNEEESEEDSYTMDDDFEDTVVRIVDFQDSTAPRIDESQEDESQADEKRKNNLKKNNLKKNNLKKKLIKKDQLKKEFGRGLSEDVQQYNDQEMMQDLQSKTKKQLLILAKERGIDCKTSWKKAKIIDTLQGSK